MCLYKATHFYKWKLVAFKLTIVIVTQLSLHELHFLASRSQYVNVICALAIATIRTMLDTQVTKVLNPVESCCDDNSSEGNIDTQNNITIITW